MRSIIQKIKSAEKIVIEPEAEEFVLNVSSNTVKILLNYMEKFNLLNETITLDTAIKMCTNISFLTFEDYTKLIKNKKMKEAIKLIYEVYDRGYSVMDILDNYFLFVKNTEIISEDEKYEVIPFICKYITVFHNIHEDEIELALFTNNLSKILDV